MPLFMLFPSGHIIKSGSLSSTPLCPPFTHVINPSALAQMEGMAPADGPMLRVQVLPKNPRCLGSLREGLKLLNQADPCVQVGLHPRTIVSQDVQTRFSVQMAFAKFLSKIKGNFLRECCIHDTGTVLKISLYFR